MRKLKPNWFETLVRARRILRPRPPEPRPTSTSSAAESARALAAHSPFRHAPICVPNSNTWPLDHCASEPEAFLAQRAAGCFCLSLVTLLFLLVASPASSAVHQVESIGLTVSDLDREARFFTEVLPFKEIS